MRHGKRFNHLGRTASHRKAMLSNMASSLLVNKRINTTLAKAKELRKYVEPLITKAKNDSTHSRRVVFSYLQDKESVSVLFNEVVDRVANRPGGYTRIIKLGSRLGDNAEMAMIELVDFNDLLIKESEPKKAKTRRGRRGAKSQQDSAAAKTDTKAEKKEEETKTDEKVETAAVEDVVETKAEEVQEEVKETVKTEEKEVDAKAVEVEEEKKAAKKAEKSSDQAESAEEVKAEAKDEKEPAKKTENPKDDKEGSEESAKDESEK